MRRILYVLTLLAAPAGCSSPTAVVGNYAQRIENLGGQLQIHLEFGGSGITDADLEDVEFPDTVRFIAHTTPTN